jgi:membrane protein required for colicin V production
LGFGTWNLVFGIWDLEFGTWNLNLAVKIMSTIDIILAVFLLYFAFKGFTNGFIISIATLVGLVVGFYAASHFSEFTANWLQQDMGLKSSNIKLIAYVVTFVIVIVLIFLLGKFLTGVVKTVGLGIVNRLAGVLFGIAKGVLIASFLFLLFSRIDPKGSLFTAEHKKGSVLYKPVSAVAPAVIPLLKKYTAEVQELLK